MGGRLVFALQATSSSVSRAGRRQEMTISGADNLEALRRGGAFWWEPAPEPRGSLVQMKVIEAARP